MKAEWITMHRPTVLTTLGEIRNFLDENRGHGAICPACDQKVKVYMRSLRGALVVSLIQLYRFDRAQRAAGASDEERWIADGPAWLRSHDANATNDATLLRHWGLLEIQQGERGDGSWRVGVWRLTDEGRAFVLGQISVQRFAVLHNQQKIGLSGDLVDVHAALGDRFDYRELMNLEPEDR